MAKQAVIACSPASACKADFECAEEHTSTACSICAEGHFRLGSGCVACPSGAKSIASILLTLVLIMLVLVASDDAE